MGLGGGVGPWGTTPRDPQTEIERIRSTVATYFPVYETRVTATSLILLVHASPDTLESKFDDLRRKMWDQYYVPQLRRQAGEYLVEVVRRPARSGWGSVVNVILLALTILTTVTAGALLWLSYVGGSSLGPTDFLYGGLEFAFPLLAILGCHELAHYLVARWHHVDASLPFFLPVPPPFILFGTFGAFISLREPIPDKKTLLDIGASGPLAGFAVAVPVTLLGLALSTHAPQLSVASCGPSILGVAYGQFAIGGSFLWSAINLFFPANLLTNLSPVAIAGWVGLLVTAINLLPAGQLDGGHVFRALLGDRAVYVSYGAIALLLLLGFVAYPGWLLFAVLIFVLGLRHPPPLNDISPLDLKRYGVGILAAAILVGGFVAIPIATPSNNFGLASGAEVGGTPFAEYALVSSTNLSVQDQDAFAHAYTVDAQVIAVYNTSDQPGGQLVGPALAAFLLNTSWSVQFPNGNVTYSNGTGTLPASEYFPVSAGATALLSVEFASAQTDVVTINIEIVELCSSSPMVSHSAQFTIG
jgi:Zn-dependent protease